MSLEKINIIVVDCPKGLAAFRRLLAKQDDINILAEASNCAEALSLVKKHKPHIVVLATQMADKNSYRTAEVLHAEVPEVATLLVAEPGQVALDLAEGSNLLLHPFSSVELRITLRYVFHNIENSRPRNKFTQGRTKKGLSVVRAA